MPRPIKKIDPILVNQILQYPDCANHTNRSDLFIKVATYYNQARNQMLFPEEIEPQTMMNRVFEWQKNNTVNVPYEIKMGKRGKQPGTKLSPQHLDAMRLGRKTKSAIEKQVKEGLRLPANFQSPSTGGMNKWRENMQKNFAGKNTLLTGILSGKAKACIKGMCEMCMGGPVGRVPEDPALSAAIRDCRGLTCPLYIIRPFQKKVVTE